MRVTGVRSVLITAPWTGDPFWVPGERFERTAALDVVETDEGISGVGETEPVRLADGFIERPSAPGSGITLAPDFADRYPCQAGVVEYA